MLDCDWYHSIEVEPGVWTPGKNYPNIALTRDVLARCTVDNAVCLDVGTMDGLVAVLLCRRGAARVVACDRYDRNEQIEFIKRKLNADFSYVSRVSLSQVRIGAPRLVEGPFDLIVFSGVLYHMYDPMVGLALIRSMVRPGGIVVVETYAVLSERAISYFNAGGNIEHDPHNYWNMSAVMLDYLLRFFRLRALDCRYFELKGALAEDGSKLLRVCVPCEAVIEGLADPGDTFMEFDQRDDDADYPLWRAAQQKLPLTYRPAFEALPRRGSGAVDLYAAITGTAPLAFTDSDHRLALDAKY
jgi:2-polyprenyl-3-methyl-5-hydroxy-6-metoxy-1,4-benzoquinol methylase